MKRSTKIVTTVLLTVGIAGGAAAVGKKHFKDPDKRADFAVSYIADHLELDATQEQALDVLKDQVMAKRATMKSQMSEGRAEIRELISAETFDQARALELLNAKTSTLNAEAPEVINALGNFLDSLNAEQKAEVLEFMEKRQEGRKGHRGRWSH